MEPINSFYDLVDVWSPGLLNIATKWSHRVRASRAIGVKKVLVQVLEQYLGRRREKPSSMITTLSVTNFLYHIAMYKQQLSMSIFS